MNCPFCRAEKYGEGPTRLRFECGSYVDNSTGALHQSNRGCKDRQIAQLTAELNEARQEVSRLKNIIVTPSQAMIRICQEAGELQEELDVARQELAECKERLDLWRPTWWVLDAFAFSASDEGWEEALKMYQALNAKGEIGGR